MREKISFCLRTLTGFILHIQRIYGNLLTTSQREREREREREGERERGRERERERQREREREKERERGRKKKLFNNKLKQRDTKLISVYFTALDRILLII